MKHRCRCCLTTSANAFYNIFEQLKSGTTCAENICFLAEVQIDHNDGLSQEICSNCYDEVLRICDFSLKVRKADQKLRQELETMKSRIEEDQMENIQVLDAEYFASVDDNGMQVCVIEEILDQENDQQNVLIVEEGHDMEEINIVEVLDSVKEQETKFYVKKENLLEGLAQVAATQENVNIDNQSICGDTYIPDDENDEDYLIEFDPNERNNLKPRKWKCGECKVILRGDVSYEGHMNIHRKFRPHTCDQCQTRYRCRTALKRHKDHKHSLSMKHEISTKQTLLCMVCNKSFYSEITFYLHQAIIHCQGEKCPFECDDSNENNLKQHLESIHEKEIISTTDTNYYNDQNLSPTFQCFRCSETFQQLNLLQDHVQSCQTMDKERLQEDDISNENENIIEIVKIEEADISVQCTICRKHILKRNLHKHMELHKRKEEANKVLDEKKSYLCAFCHNSFQDENQLDQHLSPECCQSLFIKCVQCNENFADLKLLQKHKREVHKAKCPYICKVCGNTFGGRAQLSAHKRLHKERPFKCGQCDKAYPRRVELEIHMRTHTGELPYECHLCDKRFAIKVRLTYHLQKHEGITHSCTHCSAVYDSRNKLKAHLFKHTGMPYKCEFCPGLGFERRIRFANHMKRVHQEILSEEELAKVFAKNTGKIVHFKNPTS